MRSVSHHFSAVLLLVFSLLLPGMLSAAESQALPAQESYCQWELKDFVIEEPLCGLKGDVERGRAIATDGSRGNCVACHVLPEQGVEAFGTIGPSLDGVASRLTIGFLRLRIVDTRKVNPMSIMPGFYRDPALIHRPAEGMAGRTFLTAQQVEDVIAYMETLK